MGEELTKRIGDNVLNTVYVDGQTLLHTDVNEIVLVCKTAINENYFDIQRLQKGEIQAGDAVLLDGASLSTMELEQLIGDDKKVPTSLQVKTYIDLAISSLDARVSALENE